MKKLLFWLAALISTFLVGIGVVAFLLFDLNIDPQVSPPAPFRSECAESSSFPGLSVAIPAIERGKSGYFPKNTWRLYNEEDNSTNDWYGSPLRAFNETSLLDNSDESREIYRFLWLRSFNNPVVVLVERSKKGASVYSKELNGGSGNSPVKIINEFKRDLSESEWCDFLRSVERAKFWAMPDTKDDLGVDGSRWVLEGVKDGRYHLVDRFTPTTGEFRKACIYMLNLSGVDTEKLKDELY